MKEILVIAYTPEQLNKSSWKIPQDAKISIVWSEEQAVAILKLRSFDEIVRMDALK